MKMDVWHQAKAESKVKLDISERGSKNNQKNLRLGDSIDDILYRDLAGFHVISGWKDTCST